MNARERCIKKWERRKERLEKMTANKVYGKYCTEEMAQIIVIEELLNDLKRLLPCADDRIPNQAQADVSQ